MDFKKYEMERLNSRVERKAITNKNGDRFTMRPFHMMKEIGSMKKHIVKGHAVGKNTAMCCPWCKQTKEVIPGQNWHFGKTICCPDCKPFVVGRPHVVYNGPPIADELKQEVGPGLALDTDRFARAQLEYYHNQLLAGMAIPAEMLNGGTFTEHSSDGPKVKGHDADMVIVDELHQEGERTGRFQCKEPNVGNFPRAEAMFRGEEYQSPWRQKYLCQPPHVSGEDIAESYEKISILVDPKMFCGGCKEMKPRSSFAGDDRGNLLCTQCLGELKILESKVNTPKQIAALSKGDEADLFDETGVKLMGRVIYAGGGVFRLEDDPKDIKVGQEMWVVVRFFDDPTAVCGKVVKYIVTHEDGLSDPQIDVWMKLKSGGRVWVRGCDVFPTEELARDKVSRLRTLMATVVKEKEER